MSELVTVPLAIISVLVIVGIIVETLHKGLNNVSSWQRALFAGALIALAFVVGRGN